MYVEYLAQYQSHNRYSINDSYYRFIANTVFVIVLSCDASVATSLHIYTNVAGHIKGSITSHVLRK